MSSFESGRLLARPRRSSNLGQEAEFTKVLEAKWNKLVTADDDEAKKIISEAREEAKSADAPFRSHLAQVAQESPNPGLRVAAKEVLDRPSHHSDYGQHLAEIARSHPDPSVRARAADVLNEL